MMDIIISIFAKFPVIVLLMLSALSVISGDFMAKYWSTNQSTVWYVGALLAYFFSGFFYIPTLLREGLIVTALIWTLLSDLGFMFIGLVIFKESLTSLQVVGVVLGLAALVVLLIAKS